MKTMILIAIVIAGYATQAQKNYGRLRSDVGANQTVLVPKTFTPDSTWQVIDGEMTKLVKIDTAFIWDVSEAMFNGTPYIFGYVGEGDTLIFHGWWFWDDPRNGRKTSFYYCTLMGDTLNEAGEFMALPQHFTETRLIIPESPNVTIVKNYHPEVWDKIIRYATSKSGESPGQREKIYNAESDWFMEAWNKYYVPGNETIQTNIEKWVAVNVNWMPDNFKSGSFYDLDYKWKDMDRREKLNRKIKEQYIDTSKKPDENKELNAYRNRNESVPPNVAMPPK